MDSTYATPRDRHLFAPGKKRILALDGGGVRGALSIAFLERLENVIAEIEGRPVRLCDWFDLIGGTSTGAIIAAGLAYGHSAREMRDFYHQLAPKIFRKPRFNIPGWRATFELATTSGRVGRYIWRRHAGIGQAANRLCRDIEADGHRKLLDVDEQSSLRLLGDA